MWLKAFNFMNVDFPIIVIYMQLERAVNQIISMKTFRYLHVPCTFWKKSPQEFEHQRPKSKEIKSYEHAKSTANWSNKSKGTYHEVFIIQSHGAWFLKFIWQVKNRSWIFCISSNTTQATLESLRWTVMLCLPLMEKVLQYYEHTIRPPEFNSLTV